MDVTIIKRDGKEEPFDIEKVKRIGKASGLEHDQVEKLANRIIDRVHKENSGKIESLKIRGFMTEELRELNPHAANLFAWYEKNK